MSQNPTGVDEVQVGEELPRAGGGCCNGGECGCGHQADQAVTSHDETGCRCGHHHGDADANSADGGCCGGNARH